MTLKRINIKRQGNQLIRDARQEEGADNKGEMGIGNFESLNRLHLHNSEEDLYIRNWDHLLSLPSPSQEEVHSLRPMLQDMIADVQVLNNRIPELKSLEGLGRPIMIAEFGFGQSTFNLLDWCAKHNGYLVTTDMPIAKPDDLQSEDYKDMYWWGVDRYWKKYEWCLRLRKHPVATKHWLWLNDDCFKVTHRMVCDAQYRQTLFYKGMVDVIFEDAIHDAVYCQDLWDKMKPYMSSESIMYGYKVGVY